MTRKAKILLCKIGKTADAAIRLTKGNSAASDELRRKGMATFIPESTGGGWVALTEKGLEEYAAID